ncbi:MAG: ATP-dependent 6-phosphofructokinase [Acidobacteria bacterium]|jgi:6-phosphofructokinase|nr:ATP-dependent 6-phosphofructokinase [Candidatus Sulfomarinibacter sp. MAG AM1]
MAKTEKYRGTIGILTGGGDVPGLNPAIRAVTVRALREGFRVLGIRRGWAGLVEIDRDRKNGSDHVIDLTEEVVNKVGRTGGTFLHSSRTRPSHVPQTAIPDHLRDRYNDDVNDLSNEVLANIEYLGIDTMVPIGGDDTLSYGVHLHKQGVPVIALPKTMDNDVPGTDYCIGFSTCVTRTIAMTHALRTSAGSHERFLVIEVFGRYAGFTALLPTMAGAANRCVIPEHPFDIEHLCERLSRDRDKARSNYSVVLVSEGATFTGDTEMMYEDDEKDMFGHKKLGGVGDRVARALREVSPKFNNGRRVNVINQRLGYLVRSGDPDATDSVVPMAFGNLAMDLILDGVSGRLINIRNGRYDNVPIDVVTSRKKVVDVGKFYNTERLRPKYTRFEGAPVFIMTSDF